MRLEAMGIILQFLYQQVKPTWLLSCFEFFATERIIIPIRFSVQDLYF